MSEGTVRGTPTKTHGTAIVVIADDNEWGVGPGMALKFPPVTDIPVDDGDYIEFTITSVQSSTLIRKILGKGIGIVRSALVNDGEQGTLMVTLANRDTGVNQKEDLTFTNNTGVALNQNDYVEFENVNVQGMTCDAVRRIESRGEIRAIPDVQNTGLIKVEQAGTGNSGVIGKDLSFQLPFPPPRVLNLRDDVEINIIDNTSCVYVQLLAAGA